MSSPHIRLAAGDTAPMTEDQLIGPETDEKPDGAPIDLTGATVVLRFQNRDGLSAAVSRAATVVSPATSGLVRLDWLATGGAVAPGEYDARWIITFGDGHVMSIPDGDDAGDDADSFLWMHVARDFVTVP